MKRTGRLICGYLEGVSDALDVITEAYEASRGIGDLGMYRDGTGSEDPTERAYHNGMLAAYKVVEKLIKDPDE